MKRRVVVIGIDGGSFDIIDPLVAKGKLPNIAKIFKEGARGVLRSTMPPMTFPAWNTFMTGVNPGVHGVFDFTEHVGGKYAIKFASAAARKSKTIWKLMSERGLKVAVIGVPLTYPPEKINGIMISGFDTPVGGAADESAFHPRELCREINDITGGYEVSADIAHLIEEMRNEEAVERILSTLSKKIKAALHIFSKDSWDFFMVLFGESDLVSHHFWRFHDPKSPFNFGQCSETAREAINSVYEKIDLAIGNFLDKIDSSTTLIIMSDHGFGGNSNRAFFLNRWLESNGFLRRKSCGLTNRILEYVKKKGLKHIPHETKVWLFRKLPIIANLTESKIRFSGIDWSNTLAYSDETPYYPTVWINLKGREPEGIVEKKDYEKVVGDIINALKEWIDPLTGAKVIMNAYRKEELYSGPYLHKAPDILLEPSLIEGYAYLSRPSYASSNGLCLTTLSEDDLKGSLFLNKSGSHRREGIFMGYGFPFGGGEDLGTVDIFDLPPTIFALLNLPLPVSWEGKLLGLNAEKRRHRQRGAVRESAYKKAGIDEQKTDEDKFVSVKWDKTVNLNENCQSSRKLTREETLILEKRLKDLGYIE